jgi:tRNA A37 methylthiotransferase MiaB
MAVQEKISARRSHGRVGATMTVLVDGHEGKAAHRAERGGCAEIDGTVRVAGGSALAVGSFARVVVTGASRHDLRARL